MVKRAKPGAPKARRASLVDGRELARAGLGRLCAAQVVGVGGTGSPPFGATGSSGCVGSSPPLRIADA
jgi:hypothetical protein